MKRAAPVPVKNLAPHTLARMAARFAALADPQRLALLQALCRGEAAVQVLADAVGIAQPSASRHLATLAAQGFVTRRRAGTAVIYALADATPQQLCDLICGHLASQVEREAGMARALRRRG